MIYLIDDKTSRRTDYGWPDSQIELYKDYIVVIDCYDKFSLNRINLSSSDNIILYHESFANAINYEHKKSVEEFFQELEKNGQMITRFSGSKNRRTLNGKVCNMPPDILYHNLEYFIQKSIDGDTDFKYLMFGQNPELEQNLHDAITQMNRENTGKEKCNSNKKLFFFVASDEGLEAPFQNVEVRDNFDYQCDDAGLCETISDELEGDKYDGIYIPLCFGETLSDFLGLRLAMLIRFSCTKNKLTPLIIYGEASYPDMLNNECFDILKMPGVHYVHTDYKSLIEISSTLADIDDTKYASGLKNIHLNIPSDIGDNHNISNKWAIHRWAHVLNASDSNIEKNDTRIMPDLYFRYLTALHAIKGTKPINPDKLKIKKDDTQPPLKILYVDDQADEGWYELLCSILYDTNRIDFDYIGNELKSWSPDQIIEKVRTKVSEFEPNVVILDLRLHPSDFGSTPIQDISGFRILEGIKKYNRGIQILIFSATNKIWNLQELTKAGADGFIVKASPTDSIDPTFTEKTIRYFISCLNECAKQTYRVEMWQQIQDDRQVLKNLWKSKKINKDYAKAVDSILLMAEDSMFAKDMKYAHASTFMNLFRVVEATANEWIEYDKPEYDEIEERSYFCFRSGEQLWNFDEKHYMAEPSQELKLQKPSLPYIQKICNILYRVGSYSENAFEVVHKRNAFMHPNTITDSELENISITDVKNVFDIVHKLIQNQKNM